ncbi:MAG TPA: ABC transporter ATP-binding protein [Terriglobia bacterium]|nr:ABC transporter ATP-binding protein [Terriglobia bacterium]
MTSLTLEALTKTFPRAGKVVDSIDLEIRNGEFFTLLGPSGCGKSTTLRMIAGFEEPSTGRILFDGNDVTHDPPNRRDIGFVFQNYALFPHLSVYKNVAFGLQVRRIPSHEMAERVSAALKEVQLTGLDNARVDQLSGGQQQRVALARALVIRPRLLLLDEPLSNLDAKLREETRAALRTLHMSTRVTTIYVTHDQSEAMAMSDRIAVLHKGRIHQLGTPEEIYERPATRFVADFIGRNNVIDATIKSSSGDSVVVAFENGREIPIQRTQRAPDVDLSTGARVAACIRAESLRLTSEGGIFSGIVHDVEYSGPVRSCSIESDAGKLEVELASSAGRLNAGQRVTLAVHPESIHLVSPT